MQTIDTTIINEKMLIKSIDALENDMGSNVGLLMQEMRGNHIQ